MDAGSIDRLELRAGERVTAAHIAQLDRTIISNTGLRGAGVRRREYPWGTHHSTDGSPGIGSAPVFQPDVSFLEDGDAEVRWNGPLAFIGSVTPTIGDDPKTARRIFDTDPETGQRPALLVPRTLFDDQGECRIYFKVSVYPSSFQPQSVQPVALPATPTREPFTAYRLALFLRLRDGTPSYDEQDDRALFSSQGFMPVNQRPDGTFEALFWALF